MVIAQDSPNKLTPAMLEDRLVEFAVRLIAVAKHLERDTAGRTISAQLVRAGTSPAANYAESRSAESRADFAHKLRIVIKELNETAVWLRIVEKSKLATHAQLRGVQSECDELRRIIGASLRTTKSRATANNQ